MSLFYELPYQSRTWYRGDGVSRDFLVQFAGGAPLDRSHVQVYIDDAILTQGWSFVIINGQDYIRFGTPPDLRTAGQAPNIKIVRVTPGTATNRAIDFESGSLLRSEDLDKAVLNALYVSQESSDLFLDQGGAAVNVNQAQDVGGIKTFTSGVVIDGNANLKFEPGTPINKVANGEQYVLAASDLLGNVEWQKTSVSAENLPSSVVQSDFPMDNPQVIVAPKKFEGVTDILNGKLKISGAALPRDKVLMSDTQGNMTLKDVVRGLRLGTTAAPIVTGEVAITPDGIGALPANNAGGNQTVSASVNFTGNIGLGDNASADRLTINSTLLIVSATAAAGKILTCTGADGGAAWLPPPQTGITSVNGQTGSTTGGAVTLTAADVGAVTVDTNQQINGPKTFTNDVNLGVDGFDKITIAGELYIPTTGTFGQVLTRTEAGKAIWQTPEPAGVSSVNGGSGAVTITADSLGAYTSQTIPTATTGQKGIMQVGSGLTVSNGVVSVSQNATLPVASATVLGGIKVGDNLSINQDGVLSAGISATTGVTSFNTRTGAVSPASGDYTAAQVTNAVTTNTAQDISGSKKFTASQTVSSSTPAVGTNGSSGVVLNTTGLIQAQRTSNDDRVFQGHAPGGGVTSYIESDGTAYFGGLVTAQTGFYSTGGMTIGDNTADGINITGTLKITGNGTPAAGKILTCTNTNGNVEWQTPANAPVTDVNNLTGNVKISLDGEANPSGNLGGVSKATNQTITGQKTFTTAQTFQANVTLGDNVADVITINGTQKIPTDAAVDKILTCTNADGTTQWRPPRVNSVKGVNETSGQIGDVVITAANVGAATTAELATVSTAADNAQTTATNAANAASAAQTTADSKLSAVSTDATTSGGQTYACLQGDGTASNKLRVVGALPLGPAGGDLTSTYPNPTIAAKAVGFSKVQDVPAASILVGPTTGTSAGTITTVGIGGGLGFATASGVTTLANTDRPDIKAASANTFTSTNTFRGNVSVSATSGTQPNLTVGGNLTVDGNTTIGSANTDTLTVEAGTTIKGSLTIPANAAAGRYLSCDASGAATWSAPPTSSFTPSITDIGSTHVVKTFKSGSQSSTTTGAAVLNQPGSVFSGVNGAGNNIKSSVGTWQGLWHSIASDGLSGKSNLEYVTVTTTGTVVTGTSAAPITQGGTTGQSNSYSFFTLTRVS